MKDNIIPITKKANPEEKKPYSILRPSRFAAGKKARVSVLKIKSFDYVENFYILSNVKSKSLLNRQ